MRVVQHLGVKQEYTLDGALVYHEKSEHSHLGGQFRVIGMFLRGRVKLKKTHMNMEKM